MCPRNEKVGVFRLEKNRQTFILLTFVREIIHKSLEKNTNTDLKH